MCSTASFGSSSSSSKVLCLPLYRLLLLPLQEQLHHLMERDELLCWHHGKKLTAWIGSTGVSWLDYLQRTTRLTRSRASRVATDHRPGLGRPHGRPTWP